MVSQKGQISTELVILLTALLIVALIILNIANTHRQELYYSHVNLEARQIAESLSFEINQVILSGEGANSSLYLPDLISGQWNYTLRTIPGNNLLEINWLNHRYTKPLLTSNVSSYTFSAGLVSISYRNKRVYFT